MLYSTYIEEGSGLERQTLQDTESKSGRQTMVVILQIADSYNQFGPGGWHSESDLARTAVPAIARGGP